MQKSTFSKGFTLIELLVVIAIISLLTTVVLGSLQSTRQKALYSKGNQELKAIQTAMELYYSKNNSYPTANTMKDVITILKADGFLPTQITTIAGVDPANISYGVAPLVFGCGRPTTNTLYIFLMNGAFYYPQSFMNELGKGMNLPHLWNNDLNMTTYWPSSYWYCFGSDK